MLRKIFIAFIFLVLNPANVAITFIFSVVYVTCIYLHIIFVVFMLTFGFNNVIIHINNSNNTTRITSDAKFSTNGR